MNQTTSPARRLSPVMVAVIMIALLFAMILIYLGLVDYVSYDQPTAGGFYLSMGALFLAFSAYMLFTARRRVLRLMSMEAAPLSTTLQCQKCGTKNQREFKRGDFVFKQTDEVCPKDNEKMTISAIYREVKEKPKDIGYV
jgi:hypothetical protein